MTGMLAFLGVAIFISFTAGYMLGKKHGHEDVHARVTEE